MSLVYWPSPILKKVSEPLTEAPDPELIATMQKVMYDHNGAGLSAIQIGIAKQLIVIDNQAPDPRVFVNAQIVAEGPTSAYLAREGCLSIPGVFEYVRRPGEITVTYRDENFMLHENVVFRGFTAHALSHEIEHTKGIVFVDHLTPARRSAIRVKMLNLKKVGMLK